MSAVAGSATVRVLRDRTAGLFLVVVVVSGFGTSAMWLAAGVWVKSLTGSDGLAALAVFAMWLPVLVGPALGAVADRIPAKPLLLGSNLVMAGLLATLPLVDSAGRIWILFVVLVLYGVSFVLMGAAESALIAGAVDARLLGDFNGLRMMASEGMKLLAPLAGAGLYARFGGGAVALLDAASFVLAAGVCALLPGREPAGATPTAGWRGELTAGIRQVWGSPVLRPLVLAGAAAMLCAGFNGAAIYAVIDGVLGHSRRTPVCCTRCRAPGPSRSGCWPVRCCGGFRSGCSRRVGSRCSRWRWRRGRCRTTRWRWWRARRSGPGCRVC